MNNPRNDDELFEQSTARLLSNLRELVRAIEETEDLQWRAPNEGRSGETLYTDTTGETVVDARRLRVRRARKHSIKSVARWADESSVLLSLLNSVVRPYEGGDNESV